MLGSLHCSQMAFLFLSLSIELLLKVQMNETFISKFMTWKNDNSLLVFFYWSCACVEWFKHDWVKLKWKKIWIWNSIIFLCFSFSSAPHVKKLKMNVHAAMFYNVRMNVCVLYVKKVCSTTKRLILSPQSFHDHIQILLYHLLCLRLHHQLFQQPMIRN